jgi:hypothetical protein
VRAALSLGVTGGGSGLTELVSCRVERVDHALQRRKSFEEVHDAGILSASAPCCALVSLPP